MRLERVLGIDIDAMLDTAGFGAGAVDVFEREAEHFGAGLLGSDDVAGDDDHGFNPVLKSERI
jgi:hypothetical protein